MVHLDLDNMLREHPSVGGPEPKPTRQISKSATARLEGLEDTPTFVQDRLEKVRKETMCIFHYNLPKPKFPDDCLKRARFLWKRLGGNFEVNMHSFLP